MLIQRSVLITGAGGFLGRHVTRVAAAQGWRTVGLGHATTISFDDPEWGLSDWIEGDITIDALGMHAGMFDTIFHCAGGASVAYSMSHPAEDFQRTVQSTLAVLEFARTARNAVKVVIPSSAGVYGLAERLPSRVDDRLEPVSPYGVHKKMAEDLTRSYARCHGVPVAIVRLFSVYGPGLRKQLLWDACERLSRGDGRFAGDGNETRDWLHVVDAAELMIRAAEYASAEHPTVNGGSGVPVTVRRVVECLATHLPNAPDLSFSGERRPGDPAHYHADITGATAWGWAPKRQLAAGLQDYAAWYLATGASL